MRKNMILKIFLKKKEHKKKIIIQMILIKRRNLKQNQMNFFKIQIYTKVIFLNNELALKNGK